MKKTAAVILTLVFLGSIYFFYLQKMNQKTVQKIDSAKDVTDPYLKKLEVDRQVLLDFLDNKSKEPFKVYAAVIRLGEFKDPLSLKVATQLATDESKLYREGAAQSLGFFSEDEALEALFELTKDRESTVRAYALKGLGDTKDSQRSEKIQNYISEGTFTDLEKVYLYTGFFKSSSTAEQNNMALQELKKLGYSNDTQVAQMASLHLVQIAPDSDVTKSLLRKKISDPKDEKVVGIGIRILASQQDSWLPNRLENLSAHKSPLVRKAVIQSLHRNCHPDRWKILNSIATGEKDKSVIETLIREATLLAGPESSLLFERLQKTNLHLEAKNLLTDSLSKVITASARPCQ